MQTATTPRKVLIAGFGSIGRRHFENLKALGVQDFVFFRSKQGTVDDESIHQWPAFTNLEQALNCKPNVAIIANPTALHLHTALRAAEANCHLFIEKPLSHTLESCWELWELARQRDLTVMVGCQFRFHPLLNRLRKEIAAGRLGEVFGADAAWGEYLPAWHPWEDYRKSYCSRDDLGGGVILTLIHPIDYLYWLFGEVRKVQATVRSLEYLATPAGEDWADLNVEFSSGVLAQVHLDYHQRPPVHSLSVWGRLGRAVCDLQEATLRWTDVAGQIVTESVPLNFERNTLFVDEMKHFLHCIEHKKQPLIPLDEGIYVLRIAIEANARPRQGGRMSRQALDRFDLTGKVAVLTGGAGMLGRQFTRALLGVGARVVVADLIADYAETAALSAAKDVDGEAVGLAVDVSNKRDVDRLVQQTLQRFDRLDLLINNAAIDPKFDIEHAGKQANTFEDYPLDLWQQSLDVNLTGAFLCCQAAGKVMLRQGSGVIVNISSTYGVVAPDQRLYQRDGEEEQTLFKPAAYAITKAAIAHLTRYLAVYWAGKHIRVNTLTPHGIANHQDDQFTRRFAQRSPLGRMASQDEMNAALLFLASDASSYMTGANLIVDGGWTAW